MRLIVLLILLISGDFSNADLCQPEDLAYSIGRNQTLLDIDSESISNLPSTCYKQFNIAGALKLKLYIDKLSLGGNKYFSYNDLGITKDVSFDKVFVSQSSCPRSPIDDTIDWTELVPNGYKMLSASSSAVCFKFTPTTVARNLGGHMKGQGVRILLVVDLAVCNRSSLPRSQINTDSHKCIERCDITGKVNACPTLVTRNTVRPFHMSTLKPQTRRPPSSVATTGTYSLTPFVNSFPSRKIPTTLNPVAVTQLKHIHVDFSKPTPHFANFYTNANTRGIGSDNHTEMPSTKSRSQTAQMTSSSVPGTTFLIRTISNGAINKHILDINATVSRHQKNEHLTTASVKQNTNPVDEVQTTTGQSTWGLSSIGDSTSQTAVLSNDNGKKSQTKTEEVFGLVDGLYILIGCLLTITVVVVVSCCMMRKYRVQSHMDHDCQTDSSSRTKTVSEGYAMPWRDNWLVRHHSSHHRDSLDDEDVFGQSENDLHLVHGNFVHQSNPELHLIHACQTSLNGSVDNIYDNNHYVLKLNNGDFDAKVKDVLRKQRLLSITSYDLSKPIQRRRAYTVSESSQDSRQSLDQASETENHATDNKRNSKHGSKKCQRSSSNVSGNGARSERVARVAGRRRRTLSQRSHASIKEENTNAPSDRNDLDKGSVMSCSSIEDARDKPTRHNITIQDSLNKSISSQGSSNISDNETQTKTISKDLPLQNGDNAVININPVYIPSYQYGTSGTMQFKK